MTLYEYKDKLIRDNKGKEEILLIKEVIVVEGKDDIAAVKKAVNAEMIATGGFGINAKVIARIKEAQKRKGVIVLTDPDFAGEEHPDGAAVPGLCHRAPGRVLHRLGGGAPRKDPLCGEGGQADQPEGAGGGFRPPAGDHQGQRHHADRHGDLLPDHGPEAVRLRRGAAHERH